MDARYYSWHESLVVDCARWIYFNYNDGYRNIVSANMHRNITFGFNATAATNMSQDINNTINIVVIVIISNTKTNQLVRINGSNGKHCPLVELNEPIDERTDLQQVIVVMTTTIRIAADVERRSTIQSGTAILHRVTAVAYPTATCETSETAKIMNSDITLAEPRLCCPSSKYCQCSF